MLEMFLGNREIGELATGGTGDRGAGIGRSNQIIEKELGTNVFFVLTWDIRLEKFLPPAYVKAKNIEHLIFKEHKKLSGMTEINAKFRYIQLCRSLKTYGMSLFKIQVSSPLDLMPRI